MSIVVLDMETYYAPDYTLSKLTTQQYVDDPRFEVIGLATKIDNEPTQWFSGSATEVLTYLKNIELEKHIVVAHNAMFDCFILSSQFGIYPKKIMDTLSMARAVHGTEVGGSLAKLAQHYGIGAKGTEVVQALGKRRMDFSQEELQKYGEYCKNDVELTHALLHQLLPHFNTGELSLIDITMKMFTDPKLVLNKAKLEEHLIEVVERKNSLLSECGITKDELMSNLKLADVLMNLGVDPPMKISKVTGKESYAFAKTDEEFKALLEHPDERVQAIVAARMGIRSTLEETRTQRFIDIANSRNTLPIPLKYYGALTGRWSASDRINCFGGDTEVLTKNGWVRFDEWDGCPIMQWSPDNRLSFCGNPIYIKKHVREEVIVMDNKFISGTFTKDHRMVRWAYPKKDMVIERTSGWVAEHSGLDYIPLSGVWDGEKYSIFTEDETRLMVAIAADGHIIPRKGRLGHTQTISFGFNKERKIARMRELLLRMAIPYTEKVFDGSKETTHFYINTDDTYFKGLGPWVLQLGKLELEAFIDELRFWDGWSHSKNGNMNFSSSIKDEVYWVATALHLTNRAATVREYSKGGKPHYQLYTKSGNTGAIDTAREITTRYYDGDVYCASVDSSYIIVRGPRGGVFICGQCQNLPRKSKIKEAIEAPEGYVIIGADLSNIELRVNMFLAGQQEPLSILADGRDLYREFGSVVFGVPPEDITPEQRFISKTCVLGLGYGSGANILRKSIKTGSGIDIGEAESVRLVSTFRSTYPKVEESWGQGHRALNSILIGRQEEYGLGSLRLPIHGQRGLRLPSGLYLRYPGLTKKHGDDGRMEFIYNAGKGKEKTRIYSCKLSQNVTQAVARCVLGEMIPEVRSRYPVVLTIHDAIYCLAPENEANEAVKFVEKVMTTSPSWVWGLPLGVEVHCGKTLADV